LLGNIFYISQQHGISIGPTDPLTLITAAVSGWPQPATTGQIHCHPQTPADKLTLITHTGGVTYWINGLDLIPEKDLRSLLSIFTHLAFLNTVLFLLSFCCYLNYYY